jgi:hypothetical protein
MRAPLGQLTGAPELPHGTSGRRVRVSKKKASALSRGRCHEISGPRSARRPDSVDHRRNRSFTGGNRSFTAGDMLMFMDSIVFPFPREIATCADGGWGAPAGGVSISGGGGSSTVTFLKTRVASSSAHMVFAGTARMGALDHIVNASPKPAERPHCGTAIHKFMMAAFKTARWRGRAPTRW